MMQQHRTVLIIDDCPEDRAIYRRYLLQELQYSYHIVEEDSGEAGLAVCRSLQPEIILLDYLLPDLDGLEFLNELKNQSSGDLPPIVMLTGHGDEAIAVQALKNGVDDYLVKGKTTAENLRLAVRSAIENFELRQQLQQSETRLRLALEAAQMGTWEWDILTGKESWSFSLEQLFGVEPGTFNGTHENWLERVHPEDRDRVKQTLTETLSDQQDYAIEYRIIRADGAVRWLYCRGQVYRNESGQAVRLLGVTQDISVAKQREAERKQAEIALQQQVERERLINNVAQRIRRSLDLNDVLTTTVEEVRQLLHSDRVVIFQFHPDWQGTIVVESVHPDFTPLLSTTIHDPCFEERYIEPYRQGRVLAVDDIYESGMATCYLELLSQLQVRANLVVPILQADNLWGLLIVHHCATARHWQDWEVELLQHLATQLGIAIQQSELYQQAQAELNERREAEAELQRSQLLVQQVAETVPGILYIHDLVEQHNVYINRQAAELIGYTGAEIQAMGSNALAHLMHPDDLAEVPDHFARIKAAPEGTIFDFEYRMRHRNGEWRWLCAREIVFQRTADGQASQILGIAQDITSRKQIEAELRAANERFQLATAAVNGLIYDRDLLTNQVMRSRGLTLILGYLPEETDPDSSWWEDLIEPSDYRRIHTHRKNNLHQMDRFSYEYRIRHKAGHYVWVQDCGLIVRNDSGQPVRIVGSAVDISDRKQMDEVLRTQSRVLDSMAEGVVMTNEKGNIVFTNPAFDRMFDYEEGELLGQSVAILNCYSPQENSQLAKTIKETVIQQGVWNGEFQNRKKDGSCFFTCSRISALNIGDITYLISVQEDITERKRIEAERIQLLARERAARQQAEAANRTKDEFLATVSHELRSPLNAILGWAQLLQTRTFSPDAARRALEAIERNAKIQSQLIEDLLDISRIIQGNLRLDITTVDLHAAIEAAFDVVRPAAVAKNIRLLSTLDPAIQTLSGDANRLQQVLWNLLSNAVKFTPNGGQVVVTLEGVERGRSTAAPRSLSPHLPLPAYAQITVTDTGKGIAPEFLPYVFDRFSQADSTITRSADGLGLGLAIVRQLVELHGGTVYVESPGLGQGATFTVRLPLTTPTESNVISSLSPPVTASDLEVKNSFEPSSWFEESAASEAIQTPDRTEWDAPLAGLDILVVDDDQDTCDYVATLLQTSGADVRTAPCVETALEAIALTPPNLIISDLGMPKVDGYEFLRRLKERPFSPFSSIPVIALTAYTTQDSETITLAAGFSRYLTKPLEPDDLVATILNLTLASSSTA